MAQEKQASIEEILEELRRRATRSGMPANMGIGVIYCFVEVLQHIVGACLGLSSDLAFESWSEALSERQTPIEKPHILGLVYVRACRNQCLHGNEGRDRYTDGDLLLCLGHVEKATRALHMVLLHRDFERRLAGQRVFALPSLAAIDLEVALHAVEWTERLGQAIIDAAATANLHQEFVASLRKAQDLRGKLLSDLIGRLKNKDHNDSAWPLREFARRVAPALTGEDYVRHLLPWFARYGWPEDRPRGPEPIPALRLTLQADKKYSGSYHLDRIELLDQSNPALERALEEEFGDREITRPSDLVLVVKAIGADIASASTRLLEDLVLLLRTPLHIAEDRFPHLEERRGLALGELCRCLAIQILLPPGEDRGYQRGTLGGPVLHPEARPTNTAVVREPARACAIGRRLKREPFECLIALRDATALAEHRREVIRAFEGFPVALVDLSGKYDEERLLVDLFEHADDCELGYFFERVTALRHPKEGEGVPLLILWDDARHMRHKPTPLRGEA